MSRKPSTKVKAPVQLRAAMPGTAHQLMATTGMARSTVYRHLGRLMASRSICIKDWAVAPSGHALAVYAADADAPSVAKAVKPLPMFAQCAAVVAVALKRQQRVFPLSQVWA